MDIHNDIEQYAERIEQEGNRLENISKAMEKACMVEASYITIPMAVYEDLIRKSEQVEAFKRLNRKNKYLDKNFARVFDMPEPEEE